MLNIHERTFQHQAGFFSQQRLIINEKFPPMEHVRTACNFFYHFSAPEVHESVTLKSTSVSRVNSSYFHTYHENKY